MNSFEAAAGVEMDFVKRATAIDYLANAQVFDAVKLLLQFRGRRHSFALHEQSVFASAS